MLPRRDRQLQLAVFPKQGEVKRNAVHAKSISSRLKHRPQRTGYEAVRLCIYAFGYLGFVPEGQHLFSQRFASRQHRKILRQWHASLVQTRKPASKACVRRACGIPMRTVRSFCLLNGHH